MPDPTPTIVSAEQQRLAAELVAARWAADGVDGPVNDHALVFAIAAAIADAENRGAARALTDLADAADGVPAGPVTSHQIRAEVWRYRRSGTNDGNGNNSPVDSGQAS
jgi:hypothetical protein